MDGRWQKPRLWGSQKAQDPVPQGAAPVEVGGAFLPKVPRSECWVGTREDPSQLVSPGPLELGGALAVSLRARGDASWVGACSGASRRSFAEPFGCRGGLWVALGSARDQVANKVEGELPLGSL